MEPHATVDADDLGAIASGVRASRSDTIRVSRYERHGSRLRSDDNRAALTVAEVMSTTVRVRSDLVSEQRRTLSVGLDVAGRPRLRKHVPFRLCCGRRKAFGQAERRRVRFVVDVQEDDMVADMNFSLSRRVAAQRGELGIGRFCVQVHCDPNDLGLPCRGTGAVLTGDRLKRQKRRLSEKQRHFRRYQDPDHFTNKKNGERSGKHAHDKARSADAFKEADAGRAVVDEATRNGESFIMIADAVDVYTHEWPPYHDALVEHWQPYVERRGSLCRVAQGSRCCGLSLIATAGRSPKPQLIPTDLFGTMERRLDKLDRTRRRSPQPLRSIQDQP